MKAVSKTSTIYDVARLAGVSSATVSRVLNEPNRVAKERRERVLDAIRTLGFVPKADAVAKARKSYRKIGVVAPFFTQSSFMERLRGIATVLGSQHYELVVYSIDTAEDLASYVSMLVNTRRVDGLIFLCVRPGEEVIGMLREADFPVCFVETELDGFDCVAVQNLKGGQRAAEFLFQKGCRRPGFVGESTRVSYAVGATEERFRGFEFFFANQGIVIPESRIWIGEFSDSQLDSGIASYLSQGDLPDGVFCSSDVVAARFIRFARARGIRIPEDVMVVGFDNIEIADYLGLTSVSQSLEESGAIAARLVLNRISEKNSPCVVVQVPIGIIARESTGK